MVRIRVSALFAALVHLIALVMVCEGCHPSDRTGIELTLAKRETAIETRDMELYLTCISLDYQDRDKDLDALRDEISATFQTFDSIHYTFSDRTITIDGHEARVVQNVCIEAAAGSGQKEISSREILLLRKEGDEWRITRGL